jgi:hypothetical protein
MSSYFTPVNSLATVTPSVFVATSQPASSSSYEQEQRVRKSGGAVRLETDPPSKVGALQITFIVIAAVVVLSILIPSLMGEQMAPPSK